MLSRRENLTPDGKQSLKVLLTANQRHLLKECFGQLWGLKSAVGARRFFENRKASLDGQELKTYEKFAEMIERHCADRRLLLTQEQGLARLHRGTQQQDSPLPAKGLWPARRGVRLRPNAVPCRQRQAPASVIPADFSGFHGCTNVKCFDNMTFDIATTRQ